MQNNKINFKLSSNWTSKNHACYNSQCYGKSFYLLNILIGFLTLIDTDMLRFFLEPQKNRYSDEFVHLYIPETSPI